MTWENLNGLDCPCGKHHGFSARVITGRGVLAQLPEVAGGFGAERVFVLSDRSTYEAAGRAVCHVLEKAGLTVSSFRLPVESPEPSEKAVGSAMLHFDNSCQLIVGVGSGVINDIGKLLSLWTGRPYIIVATAPSMDGYASATSSMERAGLKVSIPSRVPDVILGDSEILCKAPAKLLQAGLGDMVAKYISLCEWRIAHLLLGEYYCEEIAGLVRHALSHCAQNAQGLLRREEVAVMAVFEGLVGCGVAMAYAGVSRPASGVEHYISHVLDMRGASLHTPVELHGLQCAAGTWLAACLYEKLKAVTPDKEKAERFVKGFDYEAWKQTLRTLLGEGAEVMIAQEAKEGKYDKTTHPARLQRILDNWKAILQIVAEELPPLSELEKLLDAAGLPKTLSALGTDDGLLPLVFAATKDIRDKYVLSRLCWDLGILNDIL